MLVIRHRLGVPQAVTDLRRLAVLRSELGPERFTGLLVQATTGTHPAETITFLPGQLEQADASGT